MTMKTKIKICCISSVEEAQAAITAGADALGLVGEMPSGPGVIDDELAREIALNTPPSVATFLLTSRETGKEIVEHVSYCATTVVQIVRHIDPMEYSVISESLPDVTRVQVIHVEGNHALELVQAYEPYVDAFLLDSGRPGAATVELGGTGRSHDWRISAEIVKSTKKPVYLAGGLNPANVSDAIRRVRPHGVDLCSGVRTNGHLDSLKLNRFMQAVEPFRQEH